MIQVTVFQKNGRYSGFTSTGHAGFEKHGQDIVCAGVSALILTTANALEALTSAGSISRQEEDRIACDIGSSDHDSELLINAMLLGLQQIQTAYGKRYLSITIEEV